METDSADAAAPAERPAGRRVPFFSAVIPVFNEQDNLPELHRRLVEVFADLGRPYEIVFVDDGSSDGSFACLKALHRLDPHVRVMRFSRNFGHHLAVTAGMDAARGEVVILMDADLQDLPEEIPNLFARLEEGWDVVYGVRVHKKHSLFKRATSFLFVAGMRRMIRGFDLNSGIFRMARRNVVDTVRECRETNRFIVGLMSWSGFRQTGIEVTHGARFAGETKYTLSKQLNLGMNTLVSFTHLPLQMATYLGLLVSGTAFVYAVVVVARKMFWGLGLQGWPSLMAAVLFLGGIQLLCLGILGEYLGRILTETQRRPLYVVSERLEQGDGDDGS